MLGYWHPRKVMRIVDTQRASSLQLPQPWGGGDYNRAFGAIASDIGKPFRLDQNQGDWGRTRRTYHNKGAADYRTVREARLSPRTILRFSVLASASREDAHDGQSHSVSQGR